VRPSSLPELRLDHLERMTDDTGLIQHATYSVPLRSSGYCVDDNARALIVALHADRLNSSAETRRLVTTYLSYVQCAQRQDGSFHNFMSYGRVCIEAERCSDDCLGRAVWALGVSVRLATDPGCRQLAREMFMRALPHAHALGPRGTALAMLGVSSLLVAEPESAELRAALVALTETLLQRYQEQAGDAWRWFERSVTYDNAMLPLALFKSYAFTQDRATLRVARESLEFLEEVCFEGDHLRLVGNAGWHSRGGEKAVADEQPIDAAAFVLAFRGAYQATASATTCGACGSPSHGSRREPPGATALRLLHRRLPRRVGCRQREPQRGRREHGLLPHVSGRDAGAGRRRAGTRRSGRRNERLICLP